MPSFPWLRIDGYIVAMKACLAICFILHNTTLNIVPARSASPVTRNVHQMTVKRESSRNRPNPERS